MAALSRTPFSATVNLCSLPAEPPSGRAGVLQNSWRRFCLRRASSLFIFFEQDNPVPTSSGGTSISENSIITGAIAMHFCFTGQYTPRAFANILENPTTNRFEVAKKLIESAGGKLISMYGVPADGPGVLTIFDVPEPSSAAAIVAVVVAAGTLQNVKLTRLLTQEEITQIRQKANKLRASYTPPGA
jgi:uncharacterized protein with GYD domain